jgi:integrase/recombinase XerD
MRNDSFSVKFYLAEDKRTLDGGYPIYVRIYINRQKAEITTRQRVRNLDDWDITTQRIKHKSEINTALSKIAGDLIGLYDELKYSKKEISALILKDTFLGRGESSPMLSDFMDKFLREHILANTELAPATVNNYRTTISHINKYLESSKQKKINLKQLDTNFLRKLDSCMLNTTLTNDETQTLKRNTVNKYHTKLKAILNVAIDEELIYRNPYSTFKLKSEPSTRTFLTKPELDAIDKHKLGGNPSLIKVRDVFMFSVYTGLRFTDAMGLREENVEFDGKKYWILFKQKKTKEHLRLPMLGKAKDIYDKYLIERTIDGFVLPRISNQKVNSYLKVIAELVSLKKPLTHHVARHTSATTIFLANGVPLEVVSKQLGHSSIKSTQVYAKITNDMLSLAADKIDKILK